ncbi:MAG: ATP synthase F1 subunit gamma [Prevotellaceae bacterium]|jgi:F-type H+-transporting ATPase subunit gamma|nr:ATP synthase F1 subunit gamma [Prevotellaceae bacterium]
MAALKEVKTRIASVQSTKKITEARQMIASAQLHRSQAVLKQALLYHDTLHAMLESLAASVDNELDTPLTEERTEGETAVVIFSSNSGMNGAFNARMEKELHTFKELHHAEKNIFIPIGNKARKALLQTGCEPAYQLDHLVHKPTFDDVTALAATLTDLFLSKKAKRIELIYYHFKSVGVQDIKRQTFLPFRIAKTGNAAPANYIIEPSLPDVLEKSLPLLLRAMLYAALIDHQTSEFAARTIAMQLASENANELLDELRLTYNKVRQQNITTELLDIMGSSFA